MDREQEDMQFLGLFDIYLESYKIIFNFRRIFSKISLAFILPLSLIFLADIAVSDSLSSEGAASWLVEFVYLTFFLVFSVLSTSTVVYTVASVFTGTGRDVTFGKVMRVVPMVWKRLIVTFFCGFLVIFLYVVVLGVPIVLWVDTINDVDIARSVFILAIMILCIVGLVYMTLVWYLAGVISVLEDIKGIKAMTKSRNLIQGKMWIAIVILLMFDVAIFGIRVLFKSQVVHTGSFGVAGRLAFGFLCLLMIFSVFLFALVIETVIYFVCKSYHHENIDKSLMLDHHEVYQGEYVPVIKANDDQVEKLDV